MPLRSVVEFLQPDAASSAERALSAVPQGLRAALVADAMHAGTCNIHFAQECPTPPKKGAKNAPPHPGREQS